MLSVSTRDARRHGINLRVPNIRASDSYLRNRMQTVLGWVPGRQIQVGDLLYNVGLAEIEKARKLGILKGDKKRR